MLRIHTKTHSCKPLKNGYDNGPAYRSITGNLEHQKGENQGYCGLANEHNELSEYVRNHNFEWKHSSNPRSIQQAILNFDLKGHKLKYVLILLWKYKNSSQPKKCINIINEIFNIRKSLYITEVLFPKTEQWKQLMERNQCYTVQP